MRRLIPLLLLAACAPPEADDFRHQARVLLEAEPEAAGDRFIALADGAHEKLRVALPALEDVALAEALVAAHERGVDVQVVTDVDQSADAGVLLLQDAGVPLQLGDGPVSYFEFSINEEVSWSSEQVIMNQAFAVADHTHTLMATRAGDLATGQRVVIELHSEDLAEDLKSEHNQLMAGIDATAMTAFSAPAKAIAHSRYTYGTQEDWRLQMWLGPQQRPAKRATDAIYRARSSIWVLSDELTNEGLIRALQTKAAHGFDVRVVVGPRFGTTSSALARQLRDETPDVEKWRITEPGGVIPTMILVDVQRARDGRYHHPHAMVFSSDLYSAARLYRTTPVVNDQLIDSSLYVIESWGRPRGPLLDLMELFHDHLDRAEPL